MTTPLAPPINPIIRIAPLVSAAEQHVAAQPNQALANLPQGSTVTGFIITRDAQSNPILRTEMGDLQLTSELFLKTGAQVMIRVDGSQASRARILTIDGLTPEDYALTIPRTLTHDTIDTTAMMPYAARAGSVAPPPWAASTTAPLQAMLLQPPSLPLPSPLHHPLFSLLMGLPLPPTLARLPQSSPLQLRILAMSLPDSAPHSSALMPAHTPPTAPSQASPAPSTSFSSSVPSPSSLPFSSHPSVEALPSPPLPSFSLLTTLSNPSQTFPSTLLATQGIPDLPEATHAALFTSPLSTDIPASSSSPTAPPEPFREGIPAQVIGHEADGGLILQSRVGMLKLFTPHPLPIGTALAVEITPEARVASSPSSAPSEPISPLMPQWESLEKAAHLLNEDDDRDAPPLPPDLLRALPNLASPKLASDLLFFLHAIKSGDLEPWLGRSTLHKLERKQSGMTAQLQSDLGQMQQLLTHSPMQHWATTLIPMHLEGQIEYARLYLREEREEPSDTPATKTSRTRIQRFVMEVNLSHLGALQLDGLVQSGVSKQFDLILRSARPLPPALSQEIRALFDAALQTTGLTGYLGFQQGSQHFIRPLTELPPPSSDGAGFMA